MKRIIFTAIICAAATAVFAQSTDTAKVKADTIKTKKGMTIRFGSGEDASYININKDRDSLEHEQHQHSKAPGFSFGITLARLDLGFATIMDHGSFTLSPQNQFLSYRQVKTSNVGFDVLQFGYRFDSSFKIYLSGGFDWTNIRLRDNITILEHQPVLTYVQDNIDFSKNRFSSSYLRIPLSFDFRTREDSRGNHFHFVFGPEGGFLLNGRVKQISDEYGKQKFNDSYHFTTFRYGPFVRIGYGAWGIFAKYYVSDMFENSPEQDGLHNFSFGIMLGF
jgi:hypothetical protein